MKKNEKKRFTIRDIDVFVMTHNRADLLYETLDSILMQTVRPDVITVFDNESTDNTKSVVRGYKSRGVRYVRTVGRFGNFLMMQKMSKRPYVVHLHDDNLLHPEYLERALSALNSVDNVAGVTGAYTYFTQSFEGKYLLNTGYHLLNDFLVLDDKTNFTVHKVRAESPPYDIIVDNIGALIYRSDYFRKRVSMTWKYGKGDDLEVCMSLLEYGRLVTVSDRNCVFIRNHAGRDVNVDDNSMTLEQAMNWLGLYVESARQISDRGFWLKFIGMIFTQYPYFIKRAIYQKMPTEAFIEHVLSTMKLQGPPELAFRELLAKYRESGVVGPRRPWPIRVVRKTLKYLLPYSIVRLVQKRQMRVV